MILIYKPEEGKKKYSIGYVVELYNRDGSFK